MAVGPAFAATLDIRDQPLRTAAHGARTTLGTNCQLLNPQKSVLLEKGARGEQVLQDLEDWAAGVNAFEETFKEFLPRSFGYLT
jgi:hypothetical protein